MKRSIVAITVLLSMVSLFGGCITIATGGAADRAPEITKFEVNPAGISAGGAAILSWEVSNASSVTIEPDLGNVATHGSEKVLPSTTTTYTLTASNKSGSTKATALLTVSAASTPSTPTSSGGAAGLPIITSFSASPSSVAAGSSATLTWSVSNANSVKISGIGTVATSGSTAVYPSTTTSYVLDAYNSTGQSSATTVVSVAGSYVPPSYTPPSYTGGLPSITSFSASPSVIAPGGSSVLTWNVNNASSVSITGLGPVTASGSMIVTPTASIVLTLTASNSYGTTYQTTGITVSGSPGGTSPSGTIPHVSAFYADPPNIASGATTTLTWGTHYADAVFIDHGVGYVNANGSTTVSPYTTTTYTLTASNSYGNNVATTQVVVTPAAMPLPSSFPTINSFYNSGIVVGGGGVLEAKLYWSVSNADTVVIDHGVGSVAASGSQKVYPTSTTTYTLTATSGANAVLQTTTVVVP